MIKSKSKVCEPSLERSSLLVIDIDLSPKEEAYIRKYAKEHNIPLAELIKSFVLEYIEDELDLKAYEQALAEHMENSITYTMEDVKIELGL